MNCSLAEIIRQILRFAQVLKVVRRNKLQSYCHGLERACGWLHSREETKFMVWVVNFIAQVPLSSEATRQHSLSILLTQLLS